MLGNSGDKGCASCLEMPRRLQHRWAVDSQGGKASEEMEGTWQILFLLSLGVFSVKGSTFGPGGLLVLH